MQVDLYEGKKYPHGILASHRRAHGYVSVYEELQPVVRALKTHHDMNVREVSGTHRLLAAFPYKVRTETLGWDDQAAIIRLRYGAGRLFVITSGKKDENILDLDNGDWAYVPAGIHFQMEGTVISGMNLQLHVGAVRPM